MDSARGISGRGEWSQQMMHQALQADRAGDVYTAVKVLRKLTRKMPEWEAPFQMLVQIYKQRREWKPVLHYALCVLERVPDDRASWQNLGIASTAMGKLKSAKMAWKKLGYLELYYKLQLEPEKIALSLHSPKGREVVLADRIGPAHARISSIPQPSSGFRFGDKILFDLQRPDKVVIGRETFPAFRMLERMKMAHNQTFSALLHTSDLRKLDFLRNLCGERGLGFDNWSKAERQSSWSAPDGMEFYRELHEDAEPIAFSIVALAGKQARDALEVLRIWKQITSVDYNRLFRLS